MAIAELILHILKSASPRSTEQSMTKTHVFFLLTLICLAPSAFGAWVATADFSSCPRKYISQTSGREGNFATESECNARIASVKSSSPLACARYSCVNEGGTAPGASGSGSAEPGHELDQHIQNAISAGINGKISPGDAAGLVGLGLIGNALLAPSVPLTPEQQAAQAEAQRQSAIRAQEAAEHARLAEEAYQSGQDQKSLAFLDGVSPAFNNSSSSASSPSGPNNSSKTPNTNFRGKVLCKGGEPNLHSCYVMVCGGAYGGDPICCPLGFPKLNECDCNCYPANADFECKRYAACQYSYKLPENNGGGK